MDEKFKTCGSKVTSFMHHPLMNLFDHLEKSYGVKHPGWTYTHTWTQWRTRKGRNRVCARARGVWVSCSKAGNSTVPAKCATRLAGQILNTCKASWCGSAVVSNSDVGPSRISHQCVIYHGVAYLWYTGGYLAACCFTQLLNLSGS